jgi:hypothetical protein
MFYSILINYITLKLQTTLIQSKRIYCIPKQDENPQRNPQQHREDRCVGWCKSKGVFRHNYLTAAPPMEITVWYMKNAKAFCSSQSARNIYTLHNLQKRASGVQMKLAAATKAARRCRLAPRSLSCSVQKCKLWR